MIRLHILIAFTIPIAACAPSQEEKLLEEAKEAVRQQVRDPESVQFRESAFTSIYPDRGLVCMGEFNAKNGYGGYVGFETYRYSREYGLTTTGSEPHFQTVANACLEEIKKETEQIKNRTK